LIYLPKILSFKNLLILVFLFCLSAKGLAQFDIPEVPSKQTSVYDYANLLNSGQKSALENKLVRYSDTTSTQIVVVIIPSTKGEDISFLGAKWGQKWGIGQEGKDNGILITLATEDRKVDINTGYGIETIITDRMAEQVINRVMIPQFKEVIITRVLIKELMHFFKCFKVNIKVRDKKMTALIFAIFYPLSSSFL